MKTTKATRRSITVFAQIVQLIPRGLISRLSAAAMVKSRVLSYRDQVLSLLFGQVMRSRGLNEICDAMRAFAPALARAGGLRAPARNTLSNANRTRDPAVAEAVYWALKAFLEGVEPGFGGGRHRGRLARFRERRVFLVDATIVGLTVASLDWARYRRRKAAAKIHMRLDAAASMPSFIAIGPAAPHDSTMARELCAGVPPGSVVVADRGYNDFSFLRWLSDSGSSFVVREKARTRARTVGAADAAGLPDGILADERILLDGRETAVEYPGVLRRVTAIVEVGGRTAEMSFLTNNADWSPRTVAELYRARWGVETFFKELKQTLQVRDFYGENENAVKWQLWTAMVAHLLLRFLRFRSRWRLSYTRLVALVSALAMAKVDLLAVLAFHGTAPPRADAPPRPEAPYLPGLERFFRPAMGQRMA